MLGGVDLDLEQLVQELRVARLILLGLLERGGEMFRAGIPSRADASGPDAQSPHLGNSGDRL